MGRRKNKHHSIHEMKLTEDNNVIKIETTIKFDR